VCNPATRRWTVLPRRTRPPNDANRTPVRTSRLIRPSRRSTKSSWFPPCQRHHLRPWTTVAGRQRRCSGVRSCGRRRKTRPSAWTGSSRCQTTARQLANGCSTISTTHVATWNGAATWNGHRRHGRYACSHQALVNGKTGLLSGKACRQGRLGRCDWIKSYLIGSVGDMAYTIMDRSVCTARVLLSQGTHYIVFFSDMTAKL
jgi:hypothetical protein